MEGCLLWLSDIPPGVSVQRYGHFLTILSEKNATSEYIDLGRRPRGGESTPQEEPSEPDTADFLANRWHDAPSLARRYQMEP